MECIMGALRNFNEVWQLFSDMPEEATLNTELAALYLGISMKTLARYRQNGEGPPYIQYHSEDSKARNQKVNYVLGDLRVWRDKHKINNTMHAAQVRGLTFSTLSDFCEPHPFWIISDAKHSENKILAHALTVQDVDFRKYLLDPNASVIWHSVEEALLKEWYNKYERGTWNSLFAFVLKNIILTSEAEQEKYMLNDAL